MTEENKTGLETKLIAMIRELNKQSDINHDILSQIHSEDDISKIENELFISCYRYTIAAYSLTKFFNENFNDPTIKGLEKSLLLIVGLYEDVFKTSLNPTENL